MATSPTRRRFLERSSAARVAPTLARLDRIHGGDVAAAKRLAAADIG